MLDLRRTKGLDKLRLAAEVITDAGFIRRMGDMASAVPGKHRRLFKKPRN